MRLLEREVVIGAREERIVRGELLKAWPRRMQTGGNCSAERSGWQRKFRSASLNIVFILFSRMADERSSLFDVLFVGDLFQETTM
jgi:hypothetical protein